MQLFICGSILGALAGICIFIYYFCRGQFEDCEDVKYQLFREEEKKCVVKDQGRS